MLRRHFLKTASWLTIPLVLGLGLVSCEDRVAQRKKKAATLAKEAPRLLVKTDYPADQILSDLSPGDVTVTDSYLANTKTTLIGSIESANGDSLAMTMDYGHIAFTSKNSNKTTAYWVTKSFGNLVSRDKDGDAMPRDIFASVLTPDSKIELSSQKTEIHEIGVSDFIDIIRKTAKDDKGNLISEATLNDFKLKFIKQWSDAPGTLGEDYDLRIKWLANEKEPYFFMDDILYTIDKDAVEDICRQAKGSYQEREAIFRFDKGIGSLGGLSFSSESSHIIPRGLTLSAKGREWKTEIIHLKDENSFRLRVPDDIQTSEEDSKQVPTIFEYYILQKKEKDNRVPVSKADQPRI
jgi:hypothetical protein